MTSTDGNSEIPTIPATRLLQILGVALAVTAAFSYGLAVWFGLQNEAGGWSNIPLFGSVFFVMFAIGVVLVWYLALVAPKDL